MVDLSDVATHFDKEIQKIDDGWDVRFKSLEKSIEIHFTGCKELCVVRIDVALDKADRAHRRLDDHKKSIECLNAHKNTELGFRRAVTFGIGLIALVVTILSLIIAYIALRQ